MNVTLEAVIRGSLSMMDYLTFFKKIYIARIVLLNTYEKKVFHSPYKRFSPIPSYCVRGSHHPEYLCKDLVMILTTVTGERNQYFCSYLSFGTSTYKHSLN